MTTENFSFNEQLDVDFLLSIYEDDVDHAEMVFQTFISSIDQHLHELEKSFSGGDTEVFRKKIHKLKPVLSFVGLTGLTGKAELLERTCGNTKDIRMLSAPYNSFKDEIAAMLPIIKQDLEKLKALNN